MEELQVEHLPEKFPEELLINTLFEKNPDNFWLNSRMNIRTQEGASARNLVGYSTRRLSRITIERIFRSSIWRLHWETFEEKNLKASSWRMTKFLKSLRGRILGGVSRSSVALLRITKRTFRRTLTSLLGVLFGELLEKAPKILL